MREVERDFSSVYSRLVLCKTYRLDEDGKVLTPEEVRWKMLLIHELDLKTLLSCKQDYNVLCRLNSYFGKLIGGLILHLDREFSCVLQFHYANLNFKYTFNVKILNTKSQIFSCIWKLCFIFLSFLFITFSKYLILDVQKLLITYKVILFYPFLLLLTYYFTGFLNNFSVIH